MTPSRLIYPHDKLTANEVMVDYLDDNLRRLKRTLADLTDDGLHWQVDAQSNSIATNLWHMGRILDVFFTQLALGLPSEQECWIAGLSRREAHVYFVIANANAHYWTRMTKRLGRHVSDQMPALSIG